MRTYLDCIPCFFRQALETSQLAGADNKTQKEIIDEFSRLIPGLPMEIPPPGIARELHKIIKKQSSLEDPYKEIKKESNIKALTLYPRAKEQCRNAADPLLTAVRFSIAGNVIDYGVKKNIDLDKELELLMEREVETIQREDTRLFNYESFRENLKHTDSLLFIGDNAGEIVFDRILIETIKEMYPEMVVIFAVRGAPIINDALMEDAEMCGLEGTAKIISSGADTPGAVLSRCTPEFREILAQADMVISKGQGNFESLSNEERTIFFLLMAKCPVIAAEAGADIGDILLLRQGEAR